MKDNSHDGHADGIQTFERTNTLRAVVYSRVSTDGQENGGTSLDTQERACQEYVYDTGWTLVESIRDTASGSSLDRARYCPIAVIVPSGIRGRGGGIRSGPALQEPKPHRRSVR